MYFFIFRRLRILLHFFQQEEYDNIRFISYVRRNLIDIKLSATLLTYAIFVLAFPSTIYNLIGIGEPSIVFIFFILFGLYQYNPCVKAKKPLIWTIRSKRIFVIGFVIAVIVASLIPLLCSNVLKLILVCIIFVQLLPLSIVCANLILAPFECRIQNKYKQEAIEKIQKYQPITIGITGSYGKTSAKHILFHILSTIAPTLSTPGSVNTPMGITRVIREKLNSNHKYFIVEMGAYGKGSIERLCKITPPDFGIITAVGYAHYERFKNIQNVMNTKFELAENVVEKSAHSKNNNMIIVNSDHVDIQLIPNLKNLEQHLVYIGSNKKNTYQISNINQTKKGIKFTLTNGKDDYEISAPLYGLHHVHNIVVCFAVAKEMSIDTNVILSALKTMPQIRHRLEIITSKTGPTIIDDAYNSNISGFRSAIDTMQLFKTKKSRMIVVTPGMVELGDMHDDMHKQIGEEVAKIADYVLVVIPNRIPSFIEGLKSKLKLDNEILVFDTFSQAHQWIKDNAKKDDVILYENDLPDLYESGKVF